MIGRFTIPPLAETRRIGKKLDENTLTTSRTLNIGIAGPSQIINDDMGPEIKKPFAEEQ